MSWLKRLVGGGKEPAPAAPQPAAPQAPAPQPDRAAVLALHQELTVPRVAAYEELFGCRAKTFYPYHQVDTIEEEGFPIDVFVYEVETSSYGDIEIAVTNGMSDRRMVEAEDPSRWARRELIQYFPRCTLAHAKRLRDMAWVPHEDEFLLDTCHTIAWNTAAVPGTPFTSAFFLEPLLRSHREFEMTVAGDPVSLLWHIPITETEREFKVEHGANALIDRLQEVDLPWVFDETNRPLLVE